MSRSLRSLRFAVVIVAILASNACMSNPFAPGDAGGSGGISLRPDTIPDLCSDSANSGLPGCRYRH
jgi:hypothetical protein